jgi:hypothetical protein
MEQWLKWQGFQLKGMWNDHPLWKGQQQLQQGQQAQVGEEPSEASPELLVQISRARGGHSAQ